MPLAAHKVNTADIRILITEQSFSSAPNLSNWEKRTGLKFSFLRVASNYPTATYRAVYH